MTTLHERPVRGEVEDAPTTVPSGTAVALEAAGTGLVTVAFIVLLAWATDARSSASTGEALRVAAQGWLLAHQVPLAVPGGSVALVPGGLALLPLALLARAGAGLARVRPVAGLRDLAAVGACVGLPYAATAGVVALLAATDLARPHPVAAALAAGATAVVAAGVGAAVHARLLAALTGLLPERVREAGRAGLLALAVVLGAAALLAGASLAASFRQATALADAVAPGIGGAVGLLLLSLALVPNAVVWAASYLTGPGVGLGADTTVTVTGATLGHVPALPLLAALPEPGPAPTAAAGLLAVPVLAGLLAGRVLTHRGVGALRGELRRRALGAGVCAGLTLGLLAALASGPVGPGLPVAGATAWHVAAAGTLEVALGALFAVEWSAWRAARRAGRAAGPEGAEGPGRPESGASSRGASAQPGSRGGTGSGRPRVGEDEEEP